jgi:hypothetical protein
MAMGLAARLSLSVTCKELQSIVDYTRSPATTNSAAIDSIFSTTSIIDEGGDTNYPYYWTSTTHANMFNSGNYGVYVAFGEALGWMNFSGAYQLMDVHGAGAQRSDPKSGDPANWPTGNGPQGDVVRLYNYARCVRDGGVVAGEGGVLNPTDQPSVGSPPANAPGQPPSSGTPPQEAIDACSGARQGNPCEMTTPHGTLTGTCLPVANNQLACVPQGGPPSGRPS